MGISESSRIREVQQEDWQVVCELTKVDAKIGLARGTMGRKR